ncbi:MAG: FAD-binding protein [Candidatus Heimdallarchaeota archaeon]|nr:FAD-binding protein [Candidatus Heimdallarchaeota archaeon]
MLSENEFDYDLIIVGGGPAGVSCAITVAKHGYSVVIIDKKSRDIIGDKTCGDAIDKAALENRMRMYYDSNNSWEAVAELMTGLTRDAARFNARKARDKVLSIEGFDQGHLPSL